MNYSIVRRAAWLLLLLAAAASAIAQESGASSAEKESHYEVPGPAEPSPGGALTTLPVQVTFDWHSQASPATLSFPLPPELRIDQIEDVEVEGGVSVSSVEFRSSPSSVWLTIPEQGEGIISFERLVLLLSSDDRQPYRVGPVRLERLEPTDGPLDFQQSVSATAGGLLLAAVLQNRGSREIAVSSIDFLPAPYSAGELLAWTGSNPTEPLVLLDHYFTPAMLQERQRQLRAGEEPVLPAGFRAVLPEFPDTTVAPQEFVLFVWTPEALPRADVRYRLQPVIEYRVVGRGDSATLGLPVEIVWSP